MICTNRCHHGIVMFGLWYGEEAKNFKHAIARSSRITIPPSVFLYVLSRRSFMRCLERERESSTHANLRQIYTILSRWYLTKMDNSSYITKNISCITSNTSAWGLFFFGIELQQLWLWRVKWSGHRQLWWSLHLWIWPINTQAVNLFYYSFTYHGEAINTLAVNLFYYSFTYHVKQSTHWLNTQAVNLFYYSFTYHGEANQHPGCESLLLLLHLSWWSQSTPRLWISFTTPSLIMVKSINTQAVNLLLLLHLSWWSHRGWGCESLLLLLHLSWWSNQHPGCAVKSLLLLLHLSWWSNQHPGCESLLLLLHLSWWSQSIPRLWISFTTPSLIMVKSIRHPGCESLLLLLHLSWWSQSIPRVWISFTTPSLIMVKQSIPRGWISFTTPSLIMVKQSITTPSPRLWISFTTPSLIMVKPISTQAVNLFYYSFTYHGEVNQHPGCESLLLLLHLSWWSQSTPRLWISFTTPSLIMVKQSIPRLWISFTTPSLIMVKSINTQAVNLFYYSFTYHGEVNQYSGCESLLLLLHLSWWSNQYPGGESLLLLLHLSWWSQSILRLWISFTTPSLIMVKPISTQAVNLFYYSFTYHGEVNQYSGCESLLLLLHLSWWSNQYPGCESLLLLLHLSWWSQSILRLWISFTTPSLIMMKSINTQAVNLFYYSFTYHGEAINTQGVNLFYYSFTYHGEVNQYPGCESLLLLLHLSWWSQSTHRVWISFTTPSLIMMKSINTQAVNLFYYSFTYHGEAINTQGVNLFYYSFTYHGEANQHPGCESLYYSFTYHGEVNQYSGCESLLLLLHLSWWSQSTPMVWISFTTPSLIMVKSINTQAVNLFLLLLHLSWWSQSTPRVWISFTTPSLIMVKSINTQGVNLFYYSFTYHGEVNQHPGGESLLLLLHLSWWSQSTPRVWISFTTPSLIMVKSINTQAVNLLLLLHLSWWSQSTPRVWISFTTPSLIMVKSINTQGVYLFYYSFTYHGEVNQHPGG